MRMIKQHKIFNFIFVIFIFLAIISILISYVFDVNTVEKYIDEDNRVGEHVKTRISLFQTQMFYLSFFFGSLGLLLLIFKKNILRFFYTHKKFLKKLMFLTIFLIILFLIGESVIRIFFSEIILSEYGSGPGNSYKKNIKYNTLGYRDIEHSWTNDKDTYRILFLGDSLTFGSGIKNLEDTYPKLIQKNLNDKYGYNKIETIVLAKGGYSTLDELTVLKKTGLKFNPNLIILGYFINDAEGEGSRIGYEHMCYSHFMIPYELGDILLRHSFIYYLFESRIKYILLNMGLGKTNIDYTRHLYSDSNPYFQQHKKDLTELISIANENEIPILIVMIPSLQVDLENYLYADINSDIEDISKSNGAYFLDLLPYFQGYELSEVRLSFMDAHTNELGHKIAAKAIVEYLQKNIFLE